MKTYKEWFDDLKEPYKGQAITNFRQQSEINFGMHPDVAINKKPKKSMLYGVIISAFDWEKTEEGHFYWEELYDELRNSNANI